MRFKINGIVLNVWDFCILGLEFRSYDFGFSVNVSVTVRVMI